MADKTPVFDDPNYMSREELQEQEEEGSYDLPSSYLDLVPAASSKEAQNRSSPAYEREEKGPKGSFADISGRAGVAENTTDQVEESGDYTSIEDILSENGEGLGGQSAGNADSQSDYEDGAVEGEAEEREGRKREAGEREGGERGGKVRRKIRQSFTDREKKEVGEGDKIYVRGNIIQNRPMLSFKSFIHSRSVEELEGDGIYQGLTTTDEQKQQLGIMPEALYMTSALETWTEKLEHMSYEMQPKDTKPVSLQPRQVKQSVTPKYRGCVLYPPPLPPLNLGAPTTQRKRHAVVENLLKSEAAFLTSLKVAEHIYMQPLQKMSSPPIDREQVQTLFGPLAEVMAHHELFYTALTARTMEWGPKQTIGSVFMTFYRKEVICHYVEYVNNFTDAMGILQKSIKKKPKFVNFLKEKYKDSKTSLSLQGLLLKPVQRFPQYILFLQDLIKYTPPRHADRVTLQLALARCETIAEHLNEAKRSTEQQSIVTHLSSRISDLPFKLTDSPNRLLHTQEAVTRLILSPQGSDKLVQLKRSLLLFNNMVLCASLKKSSAATPHDVGPYNGVHYRCKWHCPLDKLSVMEPDYMNDIWDHVVKQDESEEAVLYQKLKAQYMTHTQDFLTMSRIASLISSLAESFVGLTVPTVQNHLRVLQRKIATTRDQLKSKQPGRLDLQIPSRDGTKTIHHTYMFESEKAKQSWLSTLRYAELKLKEENKMAWVYAENAEDDDFVVHSSRQLPLFVEHYHLTNTSEALSTECATRTASNQVWFVSCSSSSAEIAIIQCVTPRPIFLKSFTVDSSRILAICYAPGEGSSHQSTPRQSSNSTFPSLSTDTIWMGSQDGKLMIHCASSEVAHKCMEVINFNGVITCLEYYKNQVFIAVEGNIYIYQRPKESAWDLDNPVALRVHEEGAITCMCQVQQKLWIGAGNLCYILNMVFGKIEGHFMLSRDSSTRVRDLACSGSGVWVSFSRRATVQLFHSVTKTLLQEIDIEKAFSRIVLKHNLQRKIKSTSNLHVTSLLVCQGYLWIGTSAGAVLVYRTPYLKTIPIVTGKPYLATYAHSSGVRVLITTHTQGTLTSSRLNQFISEEQERFQEDWEATELVDESYTTTNDATSVSAEVPEIPEETESTSSTFPPLPPPIFSDEPSPTGTLEPRPSEPVHEPPVVDSVLVKGEASDSAFTENAGTSTLIVGTSQPALNGREIAENGSSAAAATGANKFNGTPPNSNDRVSYPVRRKSSTIKLQLQKQSGEVEVQQTGTFRRIPTPELQQQDTGMGTFRRIPTPEPQQQDMGTFRRLPTPEAEENGGTFRRKPTPELTGDYPAVYDKVALDSISTLNRNKSPSPYEDPATLDLTGPIPIRSMPDFFATLDQSMTPSYGSEPVVGAVYVLTGGRGLVNLRPDRRRSVHNIALSGSNDIDVSTADESCMVAYELKR